MDHDAAFIYFNIDYYAPILILFGWLTSHLGYMPIQEDVQFTVSMTFDDYVGNATLIAPKNIVIIDSATKLASGKVDWRISGKEGEHPLEWKVGDKIYQKDVLITSEQQYAEQVKNVNDGIVKQISINYKKNIVLNLLGWQLGWLGSYIIFAIIFSTILRKILQVY